MRRFVNVYVDGEDVRWQGGLATAVRDGAVVQVLPSVAGGCSAGQRAASSAQEAQSCWSS